MSASMRQDIEGLRSDISSLGGRLNAVDQRFEAVDRRFDAIDVRFDRMDAVMRTMAAAVVRIEATQADMKSYMLEKFVTRDEFHARMDGFSAKLDESRFRWAVHADTLQRHDERLSALEKRRSP